MKFSVVSTVYNDQVEIEQFIKNILSQTYKPDEIVIADGGSTDKTVGILNEYSNQGVPLKLIEGKRLSIAQGFNEAILAAQNEVVVIMAVGNVYESNFLEELVKTYSDSSASIVFAPIYGSAYTTFNRAYNVLKNNSTKGIKTPSNHGVLIETEVLKKTGLFNEGFIYAGEDAEFFLERMDKYNVTMECSVKARLTWSVPDNLTEFKKQVKNYAIGEMQWKGDTNFKHEILKLFLLVCFIILIFCLSIKGLQAWIFVCILLLYSGGRFVYRNGCDLDGITLFLSAFLKYYRSFYRIICFFRYHKYTNIVYRVKQEQIRYIDTDGSKIGYDQVGGKER